MSFEDLLVVVEASDSGRRVMESAADLAGQHQAHLTGLYLGYDPLLGFAESQLPAELLQLHQENLARAAEEARSVFDTICRAAGVSAEWRSAPEARVSALVLNARYVDLVVMSGAASNTADLVAHRYADSAVIAAGRPVLLYPETSARGKGFDHVMVAWDGSREATRAVHDAMPFLERAKKVIVMEIADRDEVMERDPGSDMARHLARHGVAVETSHAVEDEISTGDRLLSAAVDHDADLMVVGAYGHSRLREYALGGVTRYLLNHLTVPMLFSH